MMFYYNNYLEKQVLDSSGLIAFAVAYAGLLDKDENPREIKGILDDTTYLKRAYKEDKDDRLAQERAALKKEREETGR
jgi:hypothetical protein